MKLIRTNQFNPFQVWDSFLNDEFFGGKSAAYVPSVNIKEGENSFDLEFSVPGFKKEDFKVEVKDNVLTVSAEVKKSNSETKDNYFKQEFVQQSFSRSFALPEGKINEEAIIATYQEGILKLNLPKLEETAKPQPKLIEIS